MCVRVCVCVSLPAPHCCLSSFLFLTDDDSKVDTKKANNPYSKEARMRAAKQAEEDAEKDEEKAEVWKSMTKRTLSERNKLRQVSFARVVAHMCVAWTA